MRVFGAPEKATVWCPPGKVVSLAGDFPEAIDSYTAWYLKVLESEGGDTLYTLTIGDGLEVVDDDINKTLAITFLAAKTALQSYGETYPFEAGVTTDAGLDVVFFHGELLSRRPEDSSFGSMS